MPPPLRKVVVSTQEPALVAAEVPLLPEIVIPEVPEVADTTREARLQRILEILGNGGRITDVKRTITKEFAVTPDQVDRDVKDVQDEVQAQHANQASIDAVILQVKLRRHLRSRHFHALAMEPIPEKVFEAPGPDELDPMKGAFMRPLTPGEKASHMQARKNAADIAHREDEGIVELYGRQSKKWAKNPSVAIQINNNVGGATADELEVLRRLGMGE